MTDTSKFGRMTPVDPSDIVCIHCHRNACEALFSKVTGDAVCQTCAKDIRKGKDPKPHRKPAPTDAHICSECGMYKSFRRPRCKRCHFKVDRPLEERQQDIAWDKFTLDLWLQDRRHRLAKKNHRQGAH